MPSNGTGVLRPIRSVTSRRTLIYSYSIRNILLINLHFFEIRMADCR